MRETYPAKIRQISRNYKTTETRNVRKKIATMYCGMAVTQNQLNSVWEAEVNERRNMLVE